MMMGITAESNERKCYGGHDDRVYIQPSEPSFKRKKCKSCVNCGSRCLPIIIHGNTIHQYSKPTTNACCNYKPKKKGK